MELLCMRIDEIDAHLAEKDILLIDLRSAIRFQRSHISTAVRIPYRRLMAETERLARAKCIYVYCETGATSAIAARDLFRAGYPAVNLYGGFQNYHGSYLDGHCPRR